MQQAPSEVPPKGAKRYGNGYYERDWVTRFGTIRLRIARSRDKNFLPRGLKAFQRRADDADPGCLQLVENRLLLCGAEALRIDHIDADGDGIAAHSRQCA